MAAGRPPKYDEPSTPVTVTLPHRILRELTKISKDRGKAIVKCVEGLALSTGKSSKKVEIINVAENSNMIVIGPCPSLSAIDWIKLIEISPARFLLSIPSGTDIASLEVAILDLLESGTVKSDYEKQLLTELRNCLSHHRRRANVNKAEVLFIDKISAGIASIIVLAFSAIIKEETLLPMLSESFSACLC